MKGSEERMEARYSILYSLNRCAICGKTKAETPIEIHEVFNGPSREKSIKHGCCVGLCVDHHRTGKDAVHKNYQTKLKLQKAYEARFIELHGFDEFMAIFHKNYLDDIEIQRAEEKRGKLEEAYHISKGNIL